MLRFGSSVVKNGDNRGRLKGRDCKHGTHAWFLVSGAVRRQEVETGLAKLGSSGSKRMPLLEVIHEKLGMLHQGQQEVPDEKLRAILIRDNKKWRMFFGELDSF